MNNPRIFQWFGDLHKITTNLAGHGRIELDVLPQHLDVLHRLQKLQLHRGSLIAIAAVPVMDGESLPEMSIEEPLEFSDSAIRNLAGVLIEEISIAADVRSKIKPEDLVFQIIKNFVGDRAPARISPVAGETRAEQETADRDETERDHSENE